jgi:hypothetical protein
VVKQYAGRVSGTTGEEWFAVMHNLEHLKNEWLEEFDDSGSRIATWPVISWFTGDEPTARISPAQDALDQRMEALTDTMLEDRLSALDDDVEAFIDECVTTFHFNRHEMRRSYLTESDVFRNRDLLAAVLSTYWRVLVALIVLGLITVGGGIAFLWLSYGSVP